MTVGILVLLCVLVAGMLLRMPIGFSMLASGIAYLLVKRQDLGLVAEQVSNGLYNSYVLLAVPLFVFAANINVLYLQSTAMTGISLSLLTKSSLKDVTRQRFAHGPCQMVVFTPNQTSADALTALM